MFNLETQRSAIEHYATDHNVDDFVYDGLKGFIAFDIFCTENEEFFTDLICAHLDKKMGINGKGEDWPKLPEVA